MVIDLNKEIARRRIERHIDMIVAELQKQPGHTSFDVNMVDQIYRQYVHLLDDAVREQADQLRAFMTVSAVTADMIMELIMRSVPPADKAAVITTAQHIVNTVVRQLNSLVDAYTQVPPPPTPPAA